MKPSLSLFSHALFSDIALLYGYDVTMLRESGCTLSLNEGTDTDRGDVACNAAMILARLVKKAPRVIAQEIVARLEQSTHEQLSCIETISIAGPGFINITLSSAFWNSIATSIYEHAHTFFAQETSSEKKSYILEFVSANPTGPLHLGHGRNAIIGDVLGRVLSFCGHKVATEFYINDAGAQMRKLGSSLYIRCLQIFGSTLDLDDNMYHGEYVVEMAQELVEKYGKPVLDKTLEFYMDYARTKLLKQQQDDLARYGVTFDRWFSEQSLYDQGAVGAVLAELTKRNMLYEDGDALWFRSTHFGDDKDRVIKKQDGDYTYIASDIAYHADKFERKADVLVDILGQDHHGYVKRLKGTMEALGYNSAQLEVILYQLVSLKKGGELVKMSKRAGTFVTLTDIVQTVGVDVARFIFLNKKAEAHLELDIEVALKKSNENPVYYLQYAYVRTNSILSKASEKGLHPSCSSDDAFTAPEKAVLKKVVGLATTLQTIEQSLATHNLACYALDLAQTFHSFYTNNRIIDESAPEQTKRRLYLVKVVHNTLSLALELLGLSKPETM